MTDILLPDVKPTNCRPRWIGLQLRRLGMTLRRCLLIVAVTFIDAAAAGEYCLTEVSAASAVQPRVPRRQPEAEVFVGTKRYVLAAVGTYVELRDASGSAIQKRHLRQSYGGSIKELVVLPSGWTWIGVERPDYIMKVQLDRDPPYLGEPIPLRMLTEDPCHAAMGLLFGCAAANGWYSKALNRVFVTGYREYWLWPSRRTVEIIDGNERTLPVLMAKAPFLVIRDIERQGAILARGANGAPIYYDGVHIRDLQSDVKKIVGFQHYTTSPEWRSVLTAQKGRAILVLVSPHRSGTEWMTLVEVLKGGVLMPIRSGIEVGPGEIGRGVYDVGKNDLVIYHNQKVSILRDGESDLTIAAAAGAMFRNVMSRPGNADEAVFSFEVWDRDDRFGKVYEISLRKPNARCAIPLRLSKPVLLSAEGQVQ